MAINHQEALAISFRRAISRELLLACSQQELTPGKLAQRAGMPLSTLNNVLNGISPNPGVLTLLQVCQGLGLRLDELIRTAWENAQAAPELSGGDL